MTHEKPQAQVPHAPCLLPDDAMLIERIVTSIHDNPGEGAKHRAAKRQKLSIGRTLACLAAYDDEVGFFEVQPYDVSKTGVGLLHGASVEVGSHCRIGIRHQSRGDWVMVEGTVKRCEARECGVFDLGIQFAHEVDVSSFVASATG